MTSNLYDVLKAICDELEASSKPDVAYIKAFLVPIARATLARVPTP